MMKKLLLITVLSIASLGFSAVYAHGSGTPKHGGVVQSANDLSFELVSNKEGALIYIEDHDKPMAPTDMSGKLTILNGKEKSEAKLIPDSDKLEAKGVKLSKGAKVVASIKTANQKIITVRFTVE